MATITAGVGAVWSFPTKSLPASLQTLGLGFCSAELVVQSKKLKEGYPEVIVEVLTEFFSVNTSLY
jgi:hypothetical protein